MPSTQLWTHAPETYISHDCPQPRTIYVAASCPGSMQRVEAWRVEDYELHKQLYKGKASLLFKAICKRSGMFVALKLYRKARLSQLNWYQVQREIRIHSQLQHEHIITFYAAFEDSEHVYLALEYAAGGDLYEDLKRQGGCLSEDRVSRDVLGPCLSAVQYLHQKGYIWRDCKPENILIAEKGRGKVKLADFGLSIDATEERPVTRAGTLDYMAPEVVMCPEKSHPQENKEKALLGYTQAVDAWALGVLAYELIVGHPPFERETRTDTYEQIMYRRPHYPAMLSEAPRTFISAALTKSARKRPSVEELMGHPWIAAHRPQDARPAVSDAASQHTVQLPPPQPGALSTQALKKYASMKEANGPPVFNITVDASQQRHQQATAGSPSQDVAAQDVTLDISSSTTLQQDEAKQNDASSSQESSLQSLIQWAGSSVQRLSSRLLLNGGSAPASATSAPYAALSLEDTRPAGEHTALRQEVLSEVSSEDGGPTDDHTMLQQDLLSEAETRRSSSSSEGSLAALFYPPLPHEKAAASTAASSNAAATFKSQIRLPDMQVPPFLASSAQETGRLPGDSIQAHYGSMSANTSPAGKAALSSVLRPQSTPRDDWMGDETPKKQRHRQRQESTASLMDTPPSRSLVKFPSQRGSRQSGIARALSFWGPQPDVLTLE